MEGSGTNWFLGKLKHRKMELVSLDNPPLKEEALSMFDIMEAEKAFFLVVTASVSMELI